MNRRLRRAEAKRERRDGAARDPAREAARLVAAATALHRAGRLREAEAAYRLILDRQRDNPEALHLLGVLAHQRGDHKTAAELIGQAIAVDAAVALYHYHLGETHRAAGRFAQSAACYREALARDPNYGDAHYGLANALFELGAVEEAVAGYRRAIELDPGDAEAHNNLGNALMDVGRIDSAMESYRAALRARPGYTDAACNLAAALVRQDRLDEAADCYRLALGADRSLVEAHLGLGRVLLRQRTFAEAAASYRQAIALAPELPAGHLGLGLLFLEARRPREALDCFEEALRLAPDDVEALNHAARALLFLSRPNEAMARLERARTIRPDHPETHLNLGIGLQLLGRFEAAKEAIGRALALKPDLSDAYYNSVLGRKLVDAGEAERLEKLLEDPELALAQRSTLGYALAKVYDDLDRYDDAFRHLAQANDLRDREMGARAEAHIEYIDRVVAAFGADLFAGKARVGRDSDLPVFVIGMPRSGTSLVEQILASHPRVFGAGELDDIRQLARWLPPALSASAPYPECIRSLDADTARRLAGEYLERLRELAGPAERVTDKMPGNYLRLGLIALLFPRARVIHCRRDALDTCLSCYFQNFGRNQPLFANLTKLGTVYRQYERLMAHWRRVVPTPVLDVQYEDLATDQERVSRRLVEFCGLPWDDRCLDFHRQERAVATASFWQVRQPIYTTSIGRWHHYASHLGELKRALAATA